MPELKNGHKMNKYLSDKLRIISFISIIMVVFIHTNNTIVKFNSGSMYLCSKYNIFVQTFFSQEITKIAVPIFFCISGYLFFLKLNGTIDEFILKYRKRVKSLLLPYLIWSIWGLLFYIILQLFPQGKNFFTNELIANYSLTKIIETIFLYPITYQFWFVRDLMVLVIFSPIFYWLIKYFRAIPILLLFIIWLGFFNFSFVIIRNESILFFCLGAYFAMNNSDFILKKLNKKGYWIFAFLWFIILSINTTLICAKSDQTVLFLLLDKIGTLIGIIAIWSTYDIVMRNKTNPNKTIYNLSLFTFFIYAFHEPLLKIIKKGIFYISGASSTMSMINFFMAPIIAIIISVIVGNFIKKNAPGFYSLITGGR